MALPDDGCRMCDLPMPMEYDGKSHGPGIVDTKGPPVPTSDVSCDADAMKSVKLSHTSVIVDEEISTVGVCHPVEIIVSCLDRVTTGELMLS